MQSPSSKKRTRSDSLESKRFLLNILDDSDTCTPSQDLDSFIKTFENEISPSPEFTTELTQSTESTYFTESTESRRELGYLYEASDDELGLPPTNTSSTGVVEKTGELGESVELSELWGFDDEFGLLENEYGYGDVNVKNVSGEDVMLDGLFDYYTDLGFGSSEVTWQPETLPAQ